MSLNWPGLLLVAAVAGCAATPAPAPADLARFNGVYRGQAVTTGNGLECSSGSTAIRITVTNGHAYAGPRRRRHRMDGRVTEDGQIALVDDTGSHQLRGIIRGDQLTATEDLPRGSGQTRQEPGAPTACPAVVTATRAASEAPRPD